jgi:hypothetical protein
MVEHLYASDALQSALVPMAEWTQCSSRKEYSSDVTVRLTQATAFLLSRVCRA